MHTNLEIEYKTMITKEQFEKMLLAFPNHQVIQQTNTYFKAAHFTRKNSIRIRKINDTYLFTLKIPTENGIIEEEKIIQGNSIEDLNEPEILACMNSYDIHGPFLQVGALHTERHLIMDEIGELCLDKSTYGKKTDYEIEYEIKKDPQKGLERFLSILNENQIEYIPSPLSKVARCLSNMNNQ